MSILKTKQIVNKSIKQVIAYLLRDNLMADMKYRHTVVQLCRICCDITKPFQEAYGRFWYRCPKCNFLQAEVSDSLLSKINRGQGYSAGIGVGGGGYREYWIAGFLRRELDLSRILLYGTGNTPTFGRLDEEGFDVWGCDISGDLVAERKETYGERFFDAREFPQMQFDIIVAVEVLEHLLSPMMVFRLFEQHLTADGIVSGTTDFYDLGDITDHIYIESDLHISYWSRQSLRTAASAIGRRVLFFELECPGSVYPDEKFGLLWPRKRVFFIYPERFENYFETLSERYEILPIDKP